MPKRIAIVGGGLVSKYISCIICLVKFISNFLTFVISDKYELMVFGCHTFTYEIYGSLVKKGAVPRPPIQVGECNSQTPLQFA